MASAASPAMRPTRNPSSAAISRWPETSPWYSAMRCSWCAGRPTPPSRASISIPRAGASDDYAYARHIVDPSKGKIYSYVIEWGTEFRPDWTEMAEIVKDVTAVLVACCLEAPCGGEAIALSQDTPVSNFNHVPAPVCTTARTVCSL